jgi:hypothetical protein
LIEPRKLSGLGAANEIKVTLPDSGEEVSVGSQARQCRFARYRSRHSRGSLRTRCWTWRCGGKLLVGRDRRARRDVRHPNADGPAVRPYREDSRALNRKLEAYLDRDHQIGHSYFMGLKDVADLRFAWEHKVMPLLQEYFYGDGEKLLAVLGKDFVAEQKIILGKDAAEEERIVYRLRDARPDNEFVEALQRLAGRA